MYSNIHSSLRSQSRKMRHFKVIFNHSVRVWINYLTRNLRRVLRQWTKDFLCKSFSTFPYGILERPSPKCENIWPLATKSRCLWRQPFWCTIRWNSCGWSWSPGNKGKYWGRGLCWWTRGRVPHTPDVSSLKNNWMLDNVPSWNIPSNWIPSFNYSSVWIPWVWKSLRSSV